MGPVTRSRSRGSSNSDGTTVAVPQPPAVTQQQPSRRRTRAAASEDDSSDRAAKRARASPEAAASGSAPQQAASGIALRPRRTIKRRERLDPSHVVNKKAPVMDAMLLEAANILKSVRKGAPPSCHPFDTTAASGNTNARGSTASDGTTADLDGDLMMKEEEEDAGLLLSAAAVMVKQLHSGVFNLPWVEQQQVEEEEVLQEQPAVAMRRGGRARKETARAVASRTQQGSKDLKAALVASLGGGSSRKAAVSRGVRKSARRV